MFVNVKINTLYLCTHVFLCSSTTSMVILAEKGGFSDLNHFDEHLLFFNVVNVRILKKFLITRKCVNVVNVVL